MSRPIHLVPSTSHDGFTIFSRIFQLPAGVGVEGFPRAHGYVRHCAPFNMKINRNADLLISILVDDAVSFMFHYTEAFAAR